MNPTQPYTGVLLVPAFPEAARDLLWVHPEVRVAYRSSGEDAWVVTGGDRVYMDPQVALVLAWDGQVDERGCKRAFKVACPTGEEKTIGLVVGDPPLREALHRAHYARWRGLGTVVLVGENGTEVARVEPAGRLGEVVPFPASAPAAPASAPRGVVAPERWGRDHWSVIAYAFSTLGRGGELERQRMRVDGNPHPTTLRGGEQLVGHTDLDALADAEAAGVLTNVGTGFHPEVQFTPAGLVLGQWLCRQRKLGAISWSSLTWERVRSELWSEETHPILGFGVLRGVVFVPTEAYEDTYLYDGSLVAWVLPPGPGTRGRAFLNPGVELQKPGETGLVLAWDGKVNGSACARIFGEQRWIGPRDLEHVKREALREQGARAGRVVLVDERNLTTLGTE